MKSENLLFAAFPSAEMTTICCASGETCFRISTHFPMIAKIKVSEPPSATAGSCKALHKTLLHRVGNQGEYHRNVAARLLDGTKSRCTHRNYHIWLSCK